MSAMWSASSRTVTWMWPSSQFPRRTRSASRPGVATTRCTLPCNAEIWWDIERPPATSLSLSWRLCASGSRASCTCMASSRVGTSTRASGRRDLAGPASASRASIGRPKARVFPDPVRARASTSRPARASGIVSIWIANGVVIPVRASAAVSGFGRPSSAKLGPPSGASVFAAATIGVVVWFASPSGRAGRLDRAVMMPPVDAHVTGSRRTADCCARTSAARRCVARFEQRAARRRSVYGNDVAARNGGPGDLRHPDRHRASTSLGEHAQPDGLFHLLHLGDHGLVDVRADVRHDVAELAASREQLTLDVHAVLGEGPVDRGEDPWRVVVQVREAVAAGVLVESKVRQVDAQRGRTGVHVVAELAGDELADVALRFLGRAADVRGEDHVRQTTQLRVEVVATTLRLDREDVHGRARDATGENGLAKRPVVDDEATREVEEDRSRLHPRELGCAEEAGVPGPPVDVQGHDVGDVEQLVEALHPAGVAERELLAAVMEDDRHAEGFGEDGELRADVAVADDAEGAAADLVRAFRGLVPDAAVQGTVVLGQPTGERDDLGNRQLHHGACVRERRIEGRDSGARRGAQFDLVRADAIRADSEQITSLREHSRGDLGLGPDAEQLHSLQSLEQLGLVERTGARFDLDSLRLED